LVKVSHQNAGHRHPKKIQNIPHKYIIIAFSSIIKYKTGQYYARNYYSW